MNQKTIRKLLGVLLTLSMVVGLLPGVGLTALAADEVSENISLVASDSSNLKTISGTHYSVSCGYMFAGSSGMQVCKAGALTINARKGETITKVVLTYNWGNNKSSLSASAGTFDGNATISDINAQQVTISSSNTAGVKISAVRVYFEGDLNNPTVTLTGGANAKNSGGLLTQSYLPGAMDTVTYTALTGAAFPEFETYTLNGVTVERTSDTVVTISGTPTANTEITVPDAESSSKIVTWGSSIINDSGRNGLEYQIDRNNSYSDTANGITLTKSGSGYAFLHYGDWMLSGDVTLNFTTATGKFTSIEIETSQIYDGGNWTKDGNTLKWNGTPSNSVSLSGSRLYLEGVSSINFVIEMPTVSVTITPGSNMTKTTDSGAASQTGLSGAMTDVVYTANDGYYFPTDYSVATVNGISVTRDSYTQITVSGTPSADAAITLTAPTAKTTPDAPATAAAADCTTTDNNDGKLTGVTTAMEYKKSDADSWAAGTGSDITGLVPGTYYVRIKATETTNASGNQELTIKGFISYTVTFKVVNGSWNDEALTGEQTVTLTGHEGDTLKLAENQIPAVGGKPDANYKAGSWDTEPSASTAITGNTTYTYTYAPKDSISAAVTFKVANGSWDDGTTSDKTVTLSGYEGDTLKLAADQIPAVGNNPGTNYKAGSWDTEPSASTAITGNTTYIYTYAPKDSISAIVTFKVANGSWDDGTTSDKTVTLSGYEGDALKLAADQIPAVGTKPADTYKAGAWDVTPSTETAITAAATYTYSYAAKVSISQTVTFKVVNGSWDDGNTADITVTLTGYDGDTLKLTADQIPAVGTKPADTFKEGAWDVTPSAETAITAATTYTYTYAAKGSISQTVTFKVVNGSWDNGDTADITVTLTGLEGDTLKLAENQIPAVGTKPADTFKEGAWDVTPSTETAITAATTYTYTYAAKGSISQTVTFKVVNGSWDDGTTEDKTVTLTGLEGDTLKLVENQIPAVGTKPADTFKEGAWDVTPTIETAITAATTYTYTYAAKDSISQTVTFKVVNGSWDNGDTADITVTLSGLEGDTLKLAENQIPAVGTKPNDNFKAGAWDVTPTIETAITAATTYTYTYAAKDSISQTVTFKVVNGFWDNGDTADITVTLTGLEGDTLKLAENQIPAVGTKPNDNFKAGAWDVVPSTETAITAATTYTYTYAAKDSISQTVTFKVVNGSWDDGNSADITATLSGLEGDTLKLAADQIPAVGTKPNADFEAGSWDVTPSTETAITEAITYTYTYAAKDYTAAQGVIDAINALPDPTDVTTANKDAIEAARAAYDALPEDQKAKVEADTLKKLTDAEAALKAIADAGKLYYTVSGDGQDHVIESGEDATFTVKRSVADDTTYSRFSSIQVDGADVDASNYDKSEGSVIIKLKAAYLDTLSVGSHILKVLFTDGSVEIPFTVSEVSVPVIVDPTSFEDIAVPSKTFTFKKVWEGGSEKSIDFTLYKLGDIVYHHGFDKKVISKTEWQYNAWFSEATACYVIEEPVEGYKTRYENVGVYAGITDRCCDGGTIVNYKVPKTGDGADLMLWLGCALAGLALISASVYAGKRKKAHSK